MLQQYQSKLESFQHLGDVDSIWSDVEGHKEDLADFHQKVGTFEKEVNDATAHIREDIASLQQYRTKLQNYEHLGDVDSMWSDLKGFHQQVDSFKSEVNKTIAHINGDLVILHQCRARLEDYHHLRDIDSIWNDVKDHKVDLNGLHHQLKEFKEEVKNTNKDIRETMQRLEESNASAHKLLEKKLKKAYWCGGVAIGLSVLHLILQELSVI